MTTTAPGVAPHACEPVWTLPGVYAPQHDSHLLAEAMRGEGVVPGMDVVDLCTGSGILALQAARMGARVTAVDIGRRAVLTARLNALRARRHLTVRRGDLTAPLRGARFDMVVSNPPYVPAPELLPPRCGTARAWDAGLRGRALLDRVCDAAPSLLRPHGVLLLVMSAICDPPAVIDGLERGGLRAGVRDRRCVPFGPVMRARAGWLRSEGLSEPGQCEEELVIIRAERI